MNKETLAKTIAIRKLPHGLSKPSDYGLSNMEELYDLITGDTAYFEFPTTLQDDIGCEADLLNISEDLSTLFDVALTAISWWEEERKNSWEDEE